MKKIYLIPIIIILFMISGCDFNSTVPCVHEYKIDSVIDPTCQQEGKVFDVCSVCKNEILINTLDKKTHKFYETVFLPTCENE